MTHEDLIAFAQTARLHGMTIAEAEDGEIHATQMRKDRQAWDSFFKDHAVTPELVELAKSNFREGFKKVMRGLRHDEMGDNYDVESEIEALAELRMGPK